MSQLWVLLPLPKYTTSLEEWNTHLTHDKNEDLEVDVIYKWRVDLFTYIEILQTNVSLKLHIDIKHAKVLNRNAVRW